MPEPRPSFLPDNLSIRQPAFVEASATQCSAAHQVAVKHFGVSEPIEWVRLFESQNVISRNYLIRAGSRLFVMKERVGSGTLERLNAETEIAHWLFSRGVPTAEPLRSLDGDFSCEHNSGAWALFRHIKADYFSGEPGELRSAARWIARLTEMAGEIPEGFFQRAELRRNAELPFSSYVNGILLEIEELICSLEKDADAPIQCRNPEALKSIIGAIDRVAAGIEITDRLYVTHTDYHPLNILCKAGHVKAILDFEDLMVFPISAAMGFGAYKLIRQAVSLRGNHEDIGRMVRTWTEITQQSFGAELLSTEIQGLGARLRVLLLIRLVLYRKYRMHDASFMYDLPKQIRSLKEIDYIFGKV